MMVYCNLMVTTMVDSNEMFVNEAIHQGTDMRHPMCPNAIFSREKKPRPKSSAAVLEALQNTEVCVIQLKISSTILMVIATNETRSVQHLSQLWARLAAKASSECK